MNVYVQCCDDEELGKNPRSGNPSILFLVYLSWRHSREVTYSNGTTRQTINIWETNNKQLGARGCGMMTIKEVGLDAFAVVAKESTVVEASHRPDKMY